MASAYVSDPILAIALATGEAVIALAGMLVVLVSLMRLALVRRLRRAGSSASTRR